jgi:sulfur-oxidizing protein SoxY
MQRRDFLKSTLAFAGAAVLAPALFGEKLHAADDAKELRRFKRQFKKFGGTKAVDGSGMITMNIPEYPENGATVPVEVEIDHPMEEGNYIAKITVLVELNKGKHVITANYTPANGMAYLFVNAKLGGTQHVHVLAETNTGKVYTHKKKINVALGGCG